MLLPRLLKSKPTTRFFHTTLPGRYPFPRPTTTRKSTVYPYDLYYATLDEHQPQAVTFLPPSTLSKLSEIPDVGIVGWLSAGTEELQPLQFRENPVFNDFLHKFLHDHIEDDDFTKALAAHQQRGHLNINDQRVYTAWGRVSDPEDILGSVRLENGEIVKGSYESMPTHRIVSSNGLLQLGENLHAKFVAQLQRAVMR